jgi:hypothetical protein
VTASESAPFELPFGCQTARGNDAVNFEGTYDPANPGGALITGEIVIRTDLTATGCDTAASTVAYQLKGQLTAVRSGASWTGSLTGTVTRQQTWENNAGPASEETYPIALTLTGTSAK